MDNDNGAPRETVSCFLQESLFLGIAVLKLWIAKHAAKRKQKQPISKKDLKPEFVDVFLIHIGEAQLAIARAIRTETELSLKEIAKLMEKSPEVPLFKEVPFSEAQRLLKVLRKVGAGVAFAVRESS